MNSLVKDVVESLGGFELHQIGENRNSHLMLRIPGGYLKSPFEFMRVERSLE